MNKEVLKRLIIEEIKRFSELYKPKEGIGEQGLDELADKILSFSKDYISKDKLIELIKNDKENIETLNDSYNFQSAYVQAEIERKRIRIEILEELLEEN